MARPVKQSVNNEMEHNGITQGGIRQQLTLFFLPILVGSFLQQLYNTADAVVVGRFVGTAALSAVGGTTNLILNLIIGFFIGLSSGATVIISQYFGARRPEEINRTIHAAIALSLVGGVLIMGVGLVTAPTLLRLLNTPEDVMIYATPYLRIYFLGTLANLFYNVGGSILRAVGDSKGPLLVLACCTGLNVVLDIFFVAVLGLNTAGAAIATILSQLFSAVMVMILVHRKGEAFRISLKKIRFHPDLLKRILWIGLPAGIQSSLYTISNLIIQAGVNSFGTVTIASWTVFGKIDSLFWMVMDSFGIAVTTFMGQNYGAGRLDRVKKGTKVCLRMCFVMALGVSAGLWLLAEPLSHLFSTDPQVIAQATRIAHVQITFFVCWTCIQVYSCVLRAVGDSLVPMLIIAVGICGFRSLWTIFIAPLLPHHLLYTVCCYQLSWVFGSALFLLYFYRFAPLRHQLARVTKEEERAA